MGVQLCILPGLANPGIICAIMMRLLFCVDVTVAGVPGGGKTMAAILLALILAVTNSAPPFERMAPLVIRTGQEPDQSGKNTLGRLAKSKAPRWLGSYRQP